VIAKFMLEYKSLYISMGVGQYGEGEYGGSWGIRGAEVYA